MSIQSTPSAASGINRLLVDRGDMAIPGLENVAPAELKALQDGLTRFDEFAKELSKNPVFSALANAESTKFLRDLAKTVSAHADPAACPDCAQPVFTGMCGGGSRPPAQPPVAPPPPAAPPVAPPAAQTPPVSAEPPPAAPPVVAQPPAAKPDPVAPPAGQPAPLGGGNYQALGAGGVAALPGTAAGAPAASTAAGTPAAATAAGAPAAAPGQVDAGSLAQTFGTMLQQNPMAALMALGALGSILGSGGFNPLQISGANNGAQAAAGQAQALAGTGGTNQTAAPPSATPNSGNAELDAMLAAGGKGMTFEDKVALMMCQIIKKMQEDIEKRLEKLKAQAEAAEKDKGGGGGKGGGKGGGILGTIGGIAGNMIAPGVGGAIGGMVGNAVGGAVGGGGGGGGGGGEGAKGQESRNIEFEMLKNEMQKLSQMQQAFSNVLNEMHQLAMNAIRGIAK